MRSVKSKLRSKVLTSSQDRQRLKNIVLTAGCALHTILGLAKEVAGPTGVPGLQAGIGGLLSVLNIIKVTCSNSMWGSWVRSYYNRKLSKMWRMRRN